MCGIIGYTGHKEAYPILLAGLERLEYRGYDSAGICVSNRDILSIVKKKGRVENLKSHTLAGKSGIAHTRWSTHGAPSDHNAHPFTDQNQQFSLVHNGIIENYLELKEELRKDGVVFTSDTDSEVMVHLIAKYYPEKGDLKEAVLKTIPRLQGAYAFCVIKNDSNEVIGGRNGSPLVVGIGDEENFLASDVSAIIEHTRKVIYLNDFEIVIITPEQIQVYNFQGDLQKADVKDVNWNFEQAQKQGYKHFMLKEIFEQPKVFEDCSQIEVHIEKPSQIIIVACGTASYAGWVGKYVIEQLAKIPVTVEIASEFRYKEPVFSNDTLIIAISQSGETADTLAAVRLAKQQGAKTLGIINVVDSTIAREADSVIYTRAGLEIGVASTKAFFAQLVILYKIAFNLAGKTWDTALIPAIEKVLALHDSIRSLAQHYFHYQNFLYIGRNRNYPLALEGALKLKEISYIHAEAYPAGELKHGPISLVSEDVPTLAICPQDKVYDKTISNIQEIKARNGKVIAIATEGDESISKIADNVIYIPKVEEILYPFLVIIPLQLLAYHIADVKECDVDHPRSLAKSVTVE